MRVWVALSVLMLMLAGCAEDNGGEPTQSDGSGDGSVDEGTGPGSTTDGGGSTGDGGSGSSNGTPAGNATGNETAINAPPVASLNATAVSGQAPFEVTFNLTATDADGDVLTWMFDADGDGVDDVDSTNESLPLDYSFIFESPGTYTAVFNVTDGMNATSNNVTIFVTEKPPVLEEMSCTAHAGAAVVSLTTGVFNVGGCSLGSISAPRIVWEVQPGPECDIQVDTNGDNQADEPATVGKEYKSGDSFTAFCGPGAANAENKVILQVPE